MSHDSNNEQQRQIESHDDEVKLSRFEYCDEENVNINKNKYKGIFLNSFWGIQNQSENNNIQNMKSQQIYNEKSQSNKKNLDKNSYIKNIGVVEHNHKIALSHQNYNMKINNLKKLDNNSDFQMIPSQ